MEHHRRERKGQLSEINVVPYIDVMLVLLVIFMVTMPLLQKNVRINLPKTELSKKVSRSNKKPIILKIDRNGNVRFNFGKNPESTIFPKELTEKATKLVSINPKVEVLVRGEPNTKYEDIIKPIAILQAAGIKKVALIMKFEDKRL